MPLKILLCLAILGCPIVFAAAQTTEAEISVSYDRFKDETTVTLAPTPTSVPIVFVMSMFMCPGQKTCVPDAVILGPYP
jgi:hypothetical protein